MTHSRTQGLQRDPTDSSSTDSEPLNPAARDSLRATATIERTRDGGVFAVETIAVQIYDETLDTTAPELTATYHLDGTTAVLDTITTRPTVDDTTFCPADHLPLVAAADHHVTALSMVQAVYGLHHQFAHQPTRHGSDNETTLNSDVTHDSSPSNHTEATHE
jgi:hypothetical protein